MKEPLLSGTDVNSLTATGTRNQLQNRWKHGQRQCKQQGEFELGSGGWVRFACLQE